MNHTSNLRDRNKKERKWKKADTDSAHDITDPNELPWELSDSIKTPFDAFWNIYSGDLLDIITTQTDIDANQHMALNPPATSEEIKVVTSILLLSGYCWVPYRELYWSMSPDTHNESVSKIISRNSFPEIFSNLHTRDNTDIDDDRYYKVWPLFDILNTNFKRFVSANTFSVDESMIPYYGRHGAKQFIRGKPIRLGLNFGVYTCQMGAFFMRNHTVERYRFARNRIRARFWCCLWHDWEMWSDGSTVAMGNFFATLPLLDKLTDMGMYRVGTTWGNRLQGAPL